MKSEVVLESLPVDSILLERANWWFDVSWYGLLLAGVATAIAACATVIFLFVQFWSNGVREKQSDWRTSSLEVQSKKADADLARAKADIAAADARAATANARALEAQLALEKFKQPRLLSEQRMPIMAEQLKPFSGTRFDAAAIPGDPEAIIFLSHVTAVLEMAGWKWVDWNPPGGQFMLVYTIAGKPNIGQIGWFDVSLIVHPDHAAELRKAANALGTVLIAEGFRASLDVVENTSIPNKDAVHVIVGKKR